MSHERIWGFLSSRYTNFFIIIIIIGCLFFNEAVPRWYLNSSNSETTNSQSHIIEDTGEPSFLSEINLKAYAAAILTLSVWLALGIEPK